MKTIINNEDSFAKIVRFLKKYFDNVTVSKNENSNLASRSQNFWKTIYFENRGFKFTIHWNYYNSKLHLGETFHPSAPNPLNYSFTKIKLDNCMPGEFGNNYNVMFWEIETVDTHDDRPFAVSPLRLNITLKEL